MAGRRRKSRALEVPSDGEAVLEASNLPETPEPEPAPQRASVGQDQARIVNVRPGSVRLCKVGDHKAITVPGGGFVEVSDDHLRALREDRRTRIFFTGGYLKAK